LKKIWKREVSENLELAKMFDEFGFKALDLKNFKRPVFDLILEFQDRDLFRRGNEDIFHLANKCYFRINQANELLNKWADKGKDAKVEVRGKTMTVEERLKNIFPFLI